MMTEGPPILSLGERFYAPVEAARFPEHVLRFRNDRWAARVGLDGLTDERWTDHLGRFEPLPGNLPRPLALAYHGHQFRSYNPDIGDGRGFLFAQLRDQKDGRLLDLGTKGSGTTPFSRGGDGRLTLKGGVREVLASEALEALGVYTSKSLSLIETGEALTRGDEPSPTQSSLLVRLSHGHVRFGTFQRLAFADDRDGLERLLAYACEHFYPDLAGLPVAEKAPAFLSGVATRTARLAASWMAAGFVHGVLNTDNCSVTGESFDYGPWRFLPHVDPGYTAAYFDHSGLYAYGRQAEAMLWNLGQLGGALLPLMGGDGEAILTDALRGYSDAYGRAVADAFLVRLGMERGDDADDLTLVQDLLSWMAATRVPFERTMWDLFCAPVAPERRGDSPHADAYAARAFDGIAARLDERDTVGPERLSDPYFAKDGPETMLTEDIEAAWSRIDEAEDWSAFDRKVTELRGAGKAYDSFP